MPNISACLGNFNLSSMMDKLSIEETRLDLGLRQIEQDISKLKTELVEANKKVQLLANSHRHSQQTKGQLEASYLEHQRESSKLSASLPGIVNFEAEKFKLDTSLGPLKALQSELQEKQRIADQCQETTKIFPIDKIPKQLLEKWSSSVFIKHSHTNSRHLDYYKGKTIPLEEYKEVLRVVLEALKNDIESIHTKKKDIERLEALPTLMQEAQVQIQSNTTELEQMAAKSSELKSQITKNLREQAKLTQKKETLNAQKNNLPAFMDALQQMIQVLKQDAEIQNRPPIGTISWQAWGELRKAWSLQGYEGEQTIANDLSQVSQNLNNYLDQSLDTCFKHYDDLYAVVEILGKAPFKKTQDYDLFIEEYYIGLQAAFQALQSNLEAYTKLFKTENQQFKTRFEAISRAKAALEIEASKNLGDFLTRAKESRTNLEALFTCRFSLYEFLSKSNKTLSLDQFLNDINAYSEAQQSNEGRRNFVKTLFDNYPSILFDHQEVENYIGTGDYIPLINKIEHQHNGLPKFQHPINRLTIALYEYNRDFDTPFFNNKYHRPTCALSNNITEGILKKFKETNNDYYQTIKSLYEQLEQMRLYSNKLTEAHQALDGSELYEFMTTLKQDLNCFVAKHPTVPPNKAACLAFERLIMARIDSQNAGIETHVSLWKLSFRRLLLDLTKSACTYLKTGEWAFFPAKTRHQCMAENYKETSKILLMLPDRS